MTELDQAIESSFKASGASKEANKAYLEFIKANLIIPIEKHTLNDEPVVLYFEDQSHVFLPVFSTMEALHHWAQEIRDDIQVLKLSGVDLLKGIGEHTFVALNIGSPFYKEFNPSEIARMRSMVLKIFK